MDTDFHALQELLTARPASDSWLGLAPPMAPMGERADERADDRPEDAPVPGWLPGQFAIDTPLVGAARDIAMTEAYGHFADSGAASQQAEDDESASPDGDADGDGEGEGEGGYVHATQAEPDGDDTGGAAPSAAPAASPEPAAAGSSEQVFVHEQDAAEAPSNASDAGAGGDAPGGAGGAAPSGAPSGGAGAGAGAGGDAPSGAGGAAPSGAGGTGDGAAEPGDAESGEPAPEPAPEPGDGDDPDAGPTPTPGAEDSDEMQPLDMHLDEHFTFREPEQGAPAQPEQEAPAQSEQEAPAQEEFGAAPPVSSALGTTAASRKRQRAQRGISTPLPANAKINRDRTATSQISNATRGVGVSFGRDSVKDGLGTRAETEADLVTTGGAYRPRKGRVVELQPMRVTLTIRTSYGRKAKKHGPSAYGRGTTAADQKAGNTSLRFHEGNHGSASIAYVKKNPLPAFGGRVGQTVGQYKNASRAYARALKAYTRAMQSHTNNAVDEVGTKKSSL